MPTCSASIQPWVFVDAAESVMKPLPLAYTALEIWILAGQQPVLHFRCDQAVSIEAITHITRRKPNRCWC